ncbi:MAG: aldo/keto reductase [Spirochaetales bacterium]|nr:aldo/keto reductase [Spirochaetales bacterium]
MERKGLSALLMIALISMCTLYAGGLYRQKASSRILVAYFSATGTTETLAEYAADILDADLYEIEPEVPYTEADLAYYTDCRADREQRDAAARPRIRGRVEDMSKYDTVVIAHPIWHGQAPRIISTFLESYDFSGKTLVSFCTSHSSPLGSSAANLRRLLPSDVSWLESRRFARGASRAEMESWLDSIGLEAEEKVGQFDFDSRTVLLNSGYRMPIMGLGTYALDHDSCVNSVVSLLENGGRLIDTAYMYGNERAVGEGVRMAMERFGIPREDIFVITKIYPSQFDRPEAAIEMALEKLDIGYIDMLLLHHPGRGDVKAYRAMERYVDEGRIHSLGLSNFYVRELEEFLPQVRIAPALVQNEIHPYYQERDVVPFIQEKEIVVQCWYPLGGRGYTGKLLGDETIRRIARSHGVSSAQTILRWDLQRGIAVIPGSSNPEHIKENLDLFDFELTEAEMEMIEKLDRGEKHDWY